MSNERKPLLSDAGIEDIIPMPTHEDFQWMVHGGKMIRDHYEDLITTGKLRVVEEVELVMHYDPSKDMNSPNRTPSLITCSGCHAPIYYGPHSFCPECGNKIKQ